jgi:hypothetical protein
LSAAQIDGLISAAYRESADDNGIGSGHDLGQKIVIISNQPVSHKLPFFTFKSQPLN